MQKMRLLIMACAILAASCSMAADKNKKDGETIMSDQERIEKHRMGDLVIKAPPGAEIRVEQQDHHFWFGTAISRKMWSDEVDAGDREKYLEVLKENFNAVVPENAGKWYHIERKPGQRNYEDVDRMFTWCHENGLKTRGHCIYWTVPKRVQKWQKELDNETLEAKVRVHAFDMMSHFKGRVDEWDVNNEMLHGNFYEQRLGSNIRDRMFRWCKQANPDAILYLNDYDILKGKDLNAYIRQIKQFQSIGTPVGGIGVQGHFWGEYFPEDKVRESFRKLGELGLPIKVTEFDFGGTNPERQAEVFEMLYTIAFAEPQVNGVLLWGFWEGRHWRKDQAAPWRKDWTMSPAAEKHRELVFDKWWTRWEGKADQTGEAKLRVYYGTHEVTVGDETRVFEITPDNAPLTLEFAK
ncbi:MAG: endo-1,4-beta-xylanase [Candidatus Sumerlaeota bacterium]